MTAQYGILAFPAKQSLSPELHNNWFKENKIDARFDIFEILPEKFEEFLGKVRRVPILGLAVSLPYKERILDFLDEISEDAAKIGAVNTVVNLNGRLYGYNTDFLGSNRALKDVVKNLKGKKALIIGAGGAARAIAYGLLKENAEVFMFNRHPEKAEKISKDFSKIFKKQIVCGTLEDFSSMAVGFDILVQASSIWLTASRESSEEVSPNLLLENFISEKLLKKCKVVMDIVYKPLMTPLLLKSKKLKKKIITGDKMLRYQALEQQKIWRSTPI